MLPLKPFGEKGPPVQVNASVAVSRLKWIFEYEFSDPQRLILDAPEAGHWKDWQRADGLWQSTCFEAFAGKPGDLSYWEFNFSPAKRAWNVYRFENYRDPQPPAPSGDFEFEEADVKGNRMRCVLRTKIPPQPYEASLTAVVRTAAGVSHYALTHAADKADFHRRETFSLRI